MKKTPQVELTMVNRNSVENGNASSTRHSETVYIENKASKRWMCVWILMLLLVIVALIAFGIAVHTYSDAESLKAELKEEKAANSKLKASTVDLMKDLKVLKEKLKREIQAAKENLTSAVENINDKLKDIGQCASDSCHSKASCKSVNGAVVRCVCNDGYKGNGTHCEDVCDGVTPPTNLQCVYDKTAAKGYKFDCFKNCPNVSGQEVCANDFGNYLSLCHMRSEACRMYGYEMVQRLKGTTGKCSHDINAFQAGVLEWNKWVQSKTHSNIYCQTGSLDTSRFHRYSDILISVTGMIDSGATSATTGNLFKSFHTWVAGIDRANKNFTVCYTYSSRPEDSSLHDDKNKAKVKVNFVAYQKNLHRRFSYVEGDAVKIPTWKSGTKCLTFKTKMDITNTSKFIVSVSSPDKSAPLGAWVETSKNDTSKAALCVRPINITQDVPNGVQINWLHVVDQSLTANSSYSPNFDIKDTEFVYPLNDAKETTNKAVSTDYNSDDRDKIVATMMSVDNHVDDGLFGSNSNVSFTAWYQLLSSGDRTIICFGATGKDWGSSYVSTVKFFDSYNKLNLPYNSTTKNPSGKFVQDE